LNANIYDHIEDPFIVKHKSILKKKTVGKANSFEKKQTHLKKCKSIWKNQTHLKKCKIHLEKSNAFEKSKLI